MKFKKSDCFKFKSIHNSVCIYLSIYITWFGFLKNIISKIVFIKIQFIKYYIKTKTKSAEDAKSNSIKTFFDKENSKDTLDIQIWHPIYIAVKVN